MSPIRQSTDGGNSASHHYLLRSTPERLAASSSRSGEEAGSRVSSRTSVVGDGIPGTVVSGGIPAAGVVVAGVAGGGGIPAVVDLGTGGLGVATGGVRGGRVGRSGGGRGGGGGGATRRTRQPTGHAAGGTARGGVRNYSATEVDSLLQTIRAVCPIGNDHWEIVADLHSNSYADCGRTAESIKRKFSSLASTQPGSGNPTMPPAVATAKEIRELINAKAGINDLDVLDCFDEEEEEDLLDVSRPPQQITVASEAAVITQMTQLEGEPLNNQQQQDSAVTQRERRASAASSGPLSTLASVSVAQSKGRTRQNIIVSAIDSATSSSNNTFAALLQQRQLSEEFEMRQRRLEREEERARREEGRARREEERLRREEELHEMRRKESRQQEERSMLFQLAMTGLLAYLGMKKKEDDDGKPHAS